MMRTIHQLADPANASTELHAGPPLRPHRGAPAAATDEASEGARCGRRDAKQLTFTAPGTGPRVSSSEELAGDKHLALENFAERHTFRNRQVKGHVRNDGMNEPMIGEFPAEFGPRRLKVANRAINVTFSISAVNDTGTRQKIPGAGVFIAPYLALTAKHVITDIARMHSDPIVYGKALPIGVKLDQPTTLDKGRFAASPFASWDVKEFIECPYSDLVLLDVVPANNIAASLAAARWNDAMFRMRLLPPKPNARVQVFGYPAVDWEFDSESRRLDVTSSIVYSEGRVTEVFEDWRVEPQPPLPAILGPRATTDRTLTDFPCFETTAPVEAGMSGGPVFYGDDLLGIVSSGFELEEDEGSDAVRCRIATLWPLMYTNGIPTGIERVSFLSLLKSALMNCPDWRDAERSCRLEEIHGRLRARRHSPG